MQRFDDRIQAIGPYTKTLTVGVNPADNLTAVLMAHRDPRRSLGPTPALIAAAARRSVVPVDVPPWWRMAKKTSMFYSAAGRGDHARIDDGGVAVVHRLGRRGHARSTTRSSTSARGSRRCRRRRGRSPSIDDLARKGQTVFEATCSRCHGTLTTRTDLPAA